MQNRAAVLHGVHDLRIDDVPVPEPGPREVLVEVRAVGVCGSDVHYYEHGRIGPHAVREPLILGHESGGVIVQQGPGGTRHQIGQRVALEPGVPCGACQQCRTGRYNLCAEVRFFATPPVHGTFANYVTIHQDFAFPLPDPTAIELVATGRVHVETIVTGHFPLEQTELALQASKQDPESVKAVVVPAGATV
jgi:L-iditol 2-dehydrogenase